MTHIPTPAEIETLRRKAKHHDLDCTRSASEPYCDCGADEALAILDRLSPPEPEQPDEAEIMWAGAFSRWDTAKRSWGRGNGWQEAISYLRTALSELIASKDAEIAHWYHLAVGDAEGVERADAELAVLRAEIERLKGANELRQSARELRDNPNGSCSAIMQAIHLEERAAKLEAAERNPAEQCDKGFDQGSRRPADTAPVVEVTQADRAREIVKRFYPEMSPNYTGRRVRIAIEAEARGRREALEIVERHRNLCSEYPWSANHALATAFNRCVGELKRLMTEAK